MKVSYIKTLWGCSALAGNAPPYTALFARIKADGFNGVETPIWAIENKVAFKAALDEHNLSYVAMINTCTPDYTLGPGKVYERPSQRLEDHLASFQQQVTEALELHPIKINSHSGCDLWSYSTSLAFFRQALEVEKASGVVVCHETHRGRVLFSPWVTRDLLRDLPDLKITADLSHFVVVAERVFHSGDEDWKACMAEFVRATKHIHARVGYAQGPQVPDPRAPEYQGALEAHEHWWDQILAAQAALGETMMTLEPEHGTDGYQQRLPYTMIETADIWEVNSWLRARQAERISGAPWAQSHTHKE